jgi:hypothetical protein
VKFGDVVVERVRDAKELRRLLPDDLLESDVVIVKRARPPRSARIRLTSQTPTPSKSSLRLLTPVS